MHTTLTLLVVFLQIIINVSCEQQQRKPNIIWLQTDSTDGRLYDPTHPYWNKIKMQGFKEKIVGNGYVFARHYTNSPQCVPSRTSMLTSKYVHETKTYNNGQGIAKSTKTGKLDERCVSSWNQQTCQKFADMQNVDYTFLDLVQFAGYDFHPFGRFDAGAGILQDYPGTTGDGFHGGPDLGILSRGANIPGATKHEPLSETKPDMAHPYQNDINQAQKVIQFLQNHNPNSPDPLFLWLGIFAPHPPYRTNSSWLSHLNNSALGVGPDPPPRDKMHPFDIQSSILKNCWEKDYTPAERLEMRTAYWGAAAESTTILMDVFNAAEKTGHLNNTWVFFTSDHGEMSIEHRADFKNSMYEPSSRIPLIIAPFGVPGYSSFETLFNNNKNGNENGIPANVDAAHVITDPTSHIDILPTIVELTGAKLPPGVRGHSLVPYLTPQLTEEQQQQREGQQQDNQNNNNIIKQQEMKRRIEQRPNYVAIEYHSNLGSTGSFALRQGKYKLITFAHTFSWFNETAYHPMLFDLDQDPYELTDISAQNPQIVASMTNTLELEFGGVGSINTIDKELMLNDLDLFHTFFVQQCTEAQLVQAFLTEYKGTTENQIRNLVHRWSGDLLQQQQSKQPLACPKFNIHE